MRSQTQSERGQASAEFVALIALVTLLILGLLALGVQVPGLALAEAIAAKLKCSASLGESCGATSSDLELAYGRDVAAIVAAHTPELRYETGMHSLPVDFRECRSDACANGPDTGDVRRSFAGDPVAAFTHVVDCRNGGTTPPAECAGAHAGSLYAQYWLYWPGSVTSRHFYGLVGQGAHADDWESFQVRISGGHTDARASSHHGYNYTGGMHNWLSDAGDSSRDVWAADPGTYYISGGSHAGHVADFHGRGVRWTPGAAVHLIPIESLDAEALATKFAITPPWRKDVYGDPESRGT